MLAVCTGSASAAISGTSGQTTWLGTPPLTCTVGTLNGFNAYVWDEQQNINVANVFVNMANNPCPAPGSAIPGLVSGNVDSHFVHYENYTGAPGGVGSVTFQDPIVGVIFLAPDLDNTDALLGAGGTSYPTFFPFRDLTFNSSTFSINGNTMNFQLDTLSPVLGVMQMRVVTQVPSPGAVAVAGLAGLASIRRRRR
jgi:MYXO-CTERM domain-containing protein